MQSTPHPIRSVRFGAFEVDFDAGELRKSGLKVALPQAQQRITECAEPSLNCDLEGEPDAQPGK